MAGIASGHHIPGVKHLLNQCGHVQGPVLLAPSGSEGGKSGDKKVKARKWHHVNSQLPQVGIKLEK